MSVLVYKGDTIDNFGEFLPVPYIEKIEIHDAGTYEVHLALFLIVDEDEDVDSVLDRLDSFDSDGSRLLTNYILLTVNKNPDAIENLLGADKNVFGYYEQSRGTDSADARTKLDVLDFFNNGSLTDDFYDKDGNRVLKFSLCYGCEGSAGSFELYEEEIEVNFEAGAYIEAEAAPGMLSGETGPATTTVPSGDTFGSDAYEDGGTLVETPMSEEEEDTTTPDDDDGRAETMSTWGRVQTFWIFAFSSTHDYYNNVDEIRTRLDNYPQLFKKEISDLAYEQVFDGGEIVDSLQSEYFDLNTEVYNGEVIKSIGNIYYKAETINSDNIRDFMGELISEYEGVEDAQLKKVTDNISYAIETYDRKPQILTELNLIKKVFPNKSGATEVGRFYKRFEKRLSAMNKKLRANPQVSRKVFRNPKIIDLRTTAEPTYSPPAHWLGMFEAQHKYYLYGSAYMSRAAVFSLPGALQVAEADDGDYEWVITEALNYRPPEYAETYDSIVRNYGYFFFDYEKALKKIADINQVIDLSKLEDYGIPLPYDKFVVTEAQITREEDPGDIVINTVFDLTKNYPASLRSEVDNTTGDYAYMHFAPNYTGVSTTEADVLTDNEYTSMMFRNFEPMNPEGITRLTPNYRLMCFQFQDFVDDDIAYNSDVAGYGTMVRIEDNSIEIMNELIAQYEEALDFLTKYKIQAVQDAEYGSYDSENGFFNQWFINGIEEQYADDLQKAPWYRAPLIYNMFRDLFFNTFNGSMSAIIENSLVVTNNIQPLNGTFFALEKFHDDMQNFYDSNLVSGTEIGDAIGVLRATSGTIKEFNSGFSYDSYGNTDIYGTLYIQT